MIISEIEISYRTKTKAKDRLKISDSKSAFNILYNNWNKNKIEHIEEFKILLLNRNNEVLGIYDVGKGGVSCVVADVKVMFQAALKSNSSALVLCHNHPSGKVQPSEADIKLTNRVKDGCEILDFTLLDHVILCSEEDVYFSFQDKGLL